ncbi:hypothetical protein ACO0RG_000783 [Hanseniaspora osmophila]
MDSSDVNKIVGALDVIYAPQSTNEQRLQAQQFLDVVKSHQDAPLFGYTIYTFCPEDNYIIKHFGLQLLEYSIKYHWSEYDLPKTTQVRNWVQELNLKVTPQSPRYIKEKLAFLWVSVCKKIWGECLKFNVFGEPINKSSKSTASSQATLCEGGITSNGNGINVENPKNVPARSMEQLKPEVQEMLVNSWFDMDSNLMIMWSQNEGTRELVLLIFRTLFEDIFLLDDITAMKRLQYLQPLCVMLISSSEIYSKHYNVENLWPYFKKNEKGWFQVWTENLNECLNDPLKKDSSYVVRLLETLKNCLNWPFASIMVQSNIAALLFKCLLTSNCKIQVLALDSLHVLYTRPYTKTEQLATIMDVYYNSVDLLEQFYETLLFDPSVEVDDEKYPVVKKFVDMIVSFHISFLKLAENDDPAKIHILKRYLDLILKITKNSSLVVSGLTLEMWVYLLRQDDKLELLSDFNIIPQLLQFAADSLIYYEEIKDHVSKNYIDTDYQSIEEYKSFCSLYRKPIRDIIRLISCVQLDYALDWLNQRLNIFFSSPVGSVVLEQTFLPHDEEPYLGALSQLMIVECFINGCIRWKIWYDNKSPDYESKLSGICGKLEMLSNQLINLNIKEPSLLKKEVQNFALFLTMLEDNALLILLEKIITTATLEYPDEQKLENDNDEKADSIRSLKYACGLELNRMALLMPESLSKIYNDLEGVVARILDKLSYHEVVSFKSFLMIIVLKSSMPDKEAKFSQIVDPELVAWSDKDTVVGLQDLPWFMERLGIVKIAEYFEHRSINEKSDLLSISMDTEGKELKSALSKRWSHLFPVRATRIFVHYSVEKLKNDEDYSMIQNLWKPRIVPILPYILRLLFQLQAYHDSENWVSLPVTVQSFVKNSTTERFWEAGASNKTKDEFIDENMKAMSTVRDFSDSVGHIVRYTREVVLAILATVSRLGSIVYDVEGFAQELLNSIFIEKQDKISNKLVYSPGVSKHGWKHIVNTAIRPILKNCPAENLVGFTHEFMPRLFETLNCILSNYWAVYMHNDEYQPIAAAQTDDEDITEEILENTLLRQLTSVVVRLLVDNFGQLNSSKSSYNAHQQRMRNILFSDVDILFPVIKLVNNLMVFKDSKCSLNAVLIFKGIMRDSIESDPLITRFLVTDVLPNILNNILIDISYKESFYEGLLCFIFLIEKIYEVYPDCKDLLVNMSFGYDIEQLIADLANANDFKTSKLVMMQYLDHVKDQSHIKKENDTSGSSHFMTKDYKDQQLRRKMVEAAQEKLVKKNKDDGDMMNDPSTEDGAVASLFS